MRIDSSDCRPLAAALLGLAGLTLGGSPSGSTAERDPHSVVRGMTISCPGAGRIWGTDAMVRSMEELKQLGVNWITIHPYARIHGNGAVEAGGLYDDPTWLTRPIREAHRLGLKIMIKPHLAYWGSPFSWRGEIAFDSDEEWRRFFDGYRAWILRVAELCREADGFAVGTELDLTLAHEDRWRRIVAAVRARTDAPLTYSASWDRFEEVPFWDALDVIGIQAYFPLVDHEKLPTQRELDLAWERLVRRLETFSARHDRRIVFGELGYNRSSTAAVRPWDYTQGGENAGEVQRRCLNAALAAVARSDAIAGVFLWKWFPEGGTIGRRNFLKSTPAMREVIATHWQE